MLNPEQRCINCGMPILVENPLPYCSLECQYAVEDFEPLDTQLELDLLANE